jgi:hypothetical protein
MTATTEQTLYSPILEAQAAGLEKFKAEDFQPLSGTILVVLPPKIVKKGSIDLPEVSQIERNFARVSAVPEEALCPVEPGDWVIFRAGSPLPLSFQGREDFALLNYCEGPESDLLGWFEGEKFSLDMIQDEE